MASIDPGQPSLNPAQVQGPVQQQAVKTGKTVGQVRDQISQAQAQTGVTRSTIGLADSPLLPRLAKARADKIAASSAAGVGKGNPMLKPSALVALSIAIHKLMNARAGMALKEGLLSAKFTELAQEQAESLAKTIMEIAEVKAKDFEMKAIVAGVSAGISLGMGFGMLKSNNVYAMQSMGRGLESLTQVAQNALSADATRQEGALEAIKTIKEFSLRTTQDAGQNASQAARQQQEDFTQLMQLLDKLTDALTRWHNQRG